MTKSSRVSPSTTTTSSSSSTPSTRRLLRSSSLTRSSWPTPRKLALSTENLRKCTRMAYLRRSTRGRIVRRTTQTPKILLTKPRNRPTHPWLPVRLLRRNLVMQMVLLRVPRRSHKRISAPASSIMASLLTPLKITVIRR